MDKLITNRNIDYYCGNGIAFDYVAEFLVQKYGITSSTKIAICSDREVSGYYYNRFEEQFIKMGIKPYLAVVDSRTNFKGLSQADSLIKSLVDFDYGSNDWLISFGGGGVLDICGSVVSLFSCGINLMVVPTTLNSMISGALSNKSYLNCGSHKNEISTEFNPSSVIIDPTFLKTVSPKVKSSGYATVIRIALLSDLSLMSGLDGNIELRVFLNALYSAWARIESNNPLLLTIGDELANSIESYFRFMKYSEGEALALSLLTVVDHQKLAPIKSIYSALNLPTKLEGCAAKMIIKNLSESFEHKGLSSVTMVDYVDGEYKVVEYDIDKALSVFEKRLSVIMD